MDSTEWKLEARRATRHLCAGVYVDRTFCRKVLLDVYADRRRRVAPSYGFELAQVAIHARRAWWIDTAQHSLVLVVAIVGLGWSATSLVVAGMLLMTWRAAVAALRLLVEFIEYVTERRSIHVLQNIKVRLRLSLVTLVTAWVVIGLSIGLNFAASVALTPAAESSEGATVALGPAISDVFARSMILLALIAGVVTAAAAVRQFLLQRTRVETPIPNHRYGKRLRQIADEERSKVIYYADYRPFIGGGVEVTTWSFALRLVDSGKGGELVREYAKLPFSGDELIDRVKQRIQQLAREGEQETRLPGLTVEDRVFVIGTHIGENIQATPGRFTLETKEAIDESRKDPTGPARHYLACQVDAWGGELITTVFVHASLQGRMLYLEFSVWTLLPTKPEFHMPGLVGRSAMRANVVSMLRRVVDLPEEVQRGPSHLSTVFPYTFKGLCDIGRREPKRDRTDFGARVSTREEGAIAEYVSEVASWRPSEWVATLFGRRLIVEPMDPADQRAAAKTVRVFERATRKAAKSVNYFQIRDVVRYWKVIERRVLATVLDYLEEKHVDTQEYRTRATQILNSGVINYFTGPTDIRGSHMGQGDVTNQSG